MFPLRSSKRSRVPVASYNEDPEMEKILRKIQKKEEEEKKKEKKKNL